MKIIKSQNEKENENTQAQKPHIGTNLLITILYYK
jgi:hypothetical protein